MHEDADESSILGEGVLASGWGRALVLGAARERKFVPLGREIVLRKKGFGRPVEVPKLSESPLPLRLLSVLFPSGCLGVGVRRSTPLVIVVTI